MYRSGQLSRMSWNNEVASLHSAWIKSRIVWTSLMLCCRLQQDLIMIIAVSFCCCCSPQLGSQSMVSSRINQLQISIRWDQQMEHQVSILHNTTQPVISYSKNTNESPSSNRNIWMALRRGDGMASLLYHQLHCVKTPDYRSSIIAQSLDGTAPFKELE